jgi:hypothetical protein
MSRIPKPIRCRWCESIFPTEEARKEHSGSHCPVKMKVQHAERQSGRAFTWAEAIQVRDRVRKEVAMDREFEDLKK